jgi:hypothetical protein
VHRYTFPAKLHLKIGQTFFSSKDAIVTCIGLNISAYRLRISPKKILVFISHDGAHNNLNDMDVYYTTPINFYMPCLMNMILLLKYKYKNIICFSNFNLIRFTFKLSILWPCLFQLFNFSRCSKALAQTARPYTRKFPLRDS